MGLFTLIPYVRATKVNHRLRNLYVQLAVILTPYLHVLFTDSRIAVCVQSTINLDRELQFRHR